jgi:hypothetical protein
VDLSWNELNSYAWGTLKDSAAPAVSGQDWLKLMGMIFFSKWIKQKSDK